MSSAIANLKRTKLHKVHSLPVAAIISWTIIVPLKFSSRVGGEQACSAKLLPKEGLALDRSLSKFQELVEATVRLENSLNQKERNACLRDI